MDFQQKRLWVKKDKHHREIWENLLHQAGIRLEENVEYTVGLYDGDQIIATGSIAGNVLKCIAVCKQYTGGSAINQLISHLISVVFENGHRACYVYTKPSASKSFGYLGFKEIAQVRDELVFMEKASFGFPHFIGNLKQKKIEGTTIAGIVMNANPFTKGHLYLVETAAKENDIVHLFVLSEDVSAFPAADRLDLVKKGVEHLENIYVHETDHYMVSSATFPSYFLKEDSNVTKIHAVLDATIFKESIAPALGITRRYVGEEPFSKATNIYNEAMSEVFKGSLDLVILSRKRQGEEAISASKVRSLLAQGEIEKVKSLVPQTTYHYLSSPKGKMVQKKLQNKE